MKLYTFLLEGAEHIGAQFGDGAIVDLQVAHAEKHGHDLAAFATMNALIEAGPDALDKARELAENPPPASLRALADLELLAPLRPRRVWGFSCYGDHQKNAVDGAAWLFSQGQADPEASYRKLLADLDFDNTPRQAFFSTPLYYQADVHTLAGPDAQVAWPSYSNWMDYEIEIVAIVGKAGIDIDEADAADRIFGYSILNDFSARDAQMASMSAGGLPGKGKDFDKSNILGPCIVTADEVTDPYALGLEVRINGTTWMTGKPGTPNWTFAQCIAHASRSQQIAAGELFSTGCIPGGCCTELRKKLDRGAVVEFDVEKIGILRASLV